MLEEYRLSERVILRPGDVVSLKGGPYREEGDGSRRRMADRGLVVIDGLEESAAGVTITGATLSPTHNCRWRHVRIRITGEETVNAYGVTDAPYRVSKKRRPPRVEPFPVPIPPRGRRR